MKGCLDVWFLWLVGWLADWLFGLLVGCKIYKIGGGKSVNLFQKPSSWTPKSSTIGRKRALGKVLGVPRGLLEGSWGLVGRSWLVVGGLGGTNMHFLKRCVWFKRGHYFLGLRSLLGPLGEVLVWCGLVGSWAAFRGSWVCLEGS